MRARCWARTAAELSGWAAAAFAGTLLLTVLGSHLIGERAVVVLSGSMEPVFAPGDVLVERRVEASQVQIGQIVTFREPGTNTSITHRVRRVEARGPKLVFTTKGDADNSVQRWSIDASGTLGQPVRLIPQIGHVVVFAKTPLGLVAVVLLPLLAIAAWEIRRIWRPPARAGGTAAEVPNGHA